MIPTSPTQFGLVLVECLDLSITTSGNTNVRWRPRVAAPTPRVWSDLVPKSTTASPETTTQSPIVSQQIKCRNTPCLQFVIFRNIFAEKIYDYSIQVGKHCPPKRSLWVVCHNTTKSKFLYEYYKFLYHLVPAFLIDTYLRAIRRTPR